MVRLAKKFGVDGLVIATSLESILGWADTPTANRPRP